jgi:hypothetical protein
MVGRGSIAMLELISLGIICAVINLGAFVWIMNNFDWFITSEGLHRPISPRMHGYIMQFQKAWAREWVDLDSTEQRTRWGLQHAWEGWRDQGKLHLSLWW